MSDSVDKKNSHKYRPMLERTKEKVSEAKGGTVEENVKFFKSLPQYCEKDTFSKVWCIRSNGNRVSKWEYTCNICKTDKFSVNGYPSSFTSYKSTIIKGKPCRCNPKYKWSEDERLFQIKDLCKKEGHTFIAWSDDKFKGFMWVCNEGHKTSSRTSSFVNDGYRCKYCRDEGNGINGYYKDKIDKEDKLYILMFKNFIKIGRSFDVTKRIIGIKNTSGELPKLLHTYTGTHKHIYEVEQDIMNKLREKGFQVSLDWTTECFNKDCYDFVKHLLNKCDLHRIDY